MDAISEKNDYEKHVIVLTDGQVNEPEAIIQLLGIIFYILPVLFFSFI